MLKCRLGRCRVPKRPHYGLPQGVILELIVDVFLMFLWVFIHHCKNRIKIVVLTISKLQRIWGWMTFCVLGWLVRGSGKMAGGGSNPRRDKKTHRARPLGAPVSLDTCRGGARARARAHHLGAHKARVLRRLSLLEGARSWGAVARARWPRVGHGRGA